MLCNFIIFIDWGIMIRKISKSKVEIKNEV